MGMHVSQFVRDSLAKVIELVRLPDGTVIRQDSGESMFFERQLESVESRLYEKKLKLLKYRQLIPVSNRDGAGAETITYYMYTKVGMAKIISNPADDLPRSDVYATRHTANVYSIATSFGYSTQELRSAMMAGVPLDMQKTDSAQRAIREQENTLAWFGDTGFGIPGFLSNANIPTVQAPQGVSTSRLWSGKTPNEILADVRTMVSGVRQATKGVHQANTLLLPIAQYDLIAETPRSDNSDMTILEFIMKPGNSYGLTKVDWLNELTGAGTGGSDMAIVYENDPEVLEARIPMEMMALPPQVQNLSYSVPVEARNAGVVVRYPLACRTMYNI